MYECHMYVWMYVCRYVGLYVYRYAGMYVSMYVCRYVGMYVFMYVCHAWYMLEWYRIRCPIWVVFRRPNWGDFRRPKRGADPKMHATQCFNLWPFGWRNVWLHHTALVCTQSPTLALFLKVSSKASSVTALLTSAHFAIQNIGWSDGIPFVGYISKFNIW